MAVRPPSDFPPRGKPSKHKACLYKEKNKL
jgi:hypothetical protein